MLRQSSTYTVTQVEQGDDAAWRKLLSDADFLTAVEESEDLAEAFVKRMDRQTVEISRLGAPEGEAPEIWFEKGLTRESVVCGTMNHQQIPSLRIWIPCHHHHAESSGAAITITCI